MTTMAVPMFGNSYQFELVEKKVQHVNAGITFVQGTNLVFRGILAMALVTKSLNTAVKLQSDLIDKLTGSSILDVPPHRLGALAGKIEQLVSVDRNVLESAPEVAFSYWQKQLARLEDQVEHLEGIAESFRMACDDEALGILAFIAKDMVNSPEQLVGALHSRSDSSAL